MGKVVDKVFKLMWITLGSMIVYAILKVWMDLIISFFTHVFATPSGILAFIVFVSILCYRNRQAIHGFVKKFKK